ncbi:hypothetical protein F3Y22_tig00111495pilonHSYRG00018 [Hibiscus syriacus]|uniref:Uncharacterized protein n=1 Tax=Hibiscus syriacus TaxID=106335 RepID=A0A6A2YI60_HIBSY|nr:hypothetical protein F3Y22_tig00111495pilonHSYRG00018 [Hibiscus syriacus]
MSSFSITRKKTPFQKHREGGSQEEGRKMKLLDYMRSSWLHFKVIMHPGRRHLFEVEQSILMRNSSPILKESVPACLHANYKKLAKNDPLMNSRNRYVPSFIPPPLAAKGKESEKKKEEERPKEKEKGKSRNIDHFMEELKHEQELRDRRNQDREHWHDGRHSDNAPPSSCFDELPDDFDPSGKLPGSFDDGDPQTTNLYVGNLSPKVDENFLLRTFGRFGPIASVKIMWPRTEEERRRQRNCGFVAFMNRADGQAAKDEMQGVVVYEYELKIGWGKSVALPSQALPAPPPGQMAIRSKEKEKPNSASWDPPPEGFFKLNVDGAVNKDRKVGGIGGLLRDSSSSSLGSFSEPTGLGPPALAELKAIRAGYNGYSPDDDHLLHVIDTMALYVLDGGCAFEQAIMERGRGNPLFSFLFELGSEEHTYYVWRLYSFAQGDTLQRWRTEPFIMITGSGRWVPPPLPTTKSPEHEKEPSATYAAGRSRRLEPERTLTDPLRDEFEDMLRALTLERSQIKEAMGFTLDNADAAGEKIYRDRNNVQDLVVMLIDHLQNPDILNSAPVKNASAYRTKFEATLPDIMESFNDLYRSVTGRITAEALKERVLKVLQVWSDWFLFSDAYVNGLRATFIRSGNSGVASFHSICGNAPEIEKNISSEDAVDGIKANHDAALAMGKGAAMKELMDLPLAELERRCRHNGLSLVGGREIMVARLINLEDAEKQRNYELDDELKLRSSSSRHLSGQRKPNAEPESLGLSEWIRYGEDDIHSERKVSVPLVETFPVPQPELKAFTKKDKINPVLPASKWAREDDDSDDEEKRLLEVRMLVMALNLNSLTDSGEDTSGRRRRDRQDDARDSARKRHRSESQSMSPPRKLSIRDRDRENGSEKEQERQRDRNRGRGHDLESEKGRDRDRERDHHEKSGGKEGMSMTGVEAEIGIGEALVA